MSGNARRKRSSAASLPTMRIVLIRRSEVSRAASARASACGWSVITTAAGSPVSSTPRRERFRASSARSPGTYTAMAIRTIAATVWRGLVFAIDQASPTT